MSKMNTRLRAMSVALFVASGAGSPAWADIKDYEFQLVDQQIKQGDAVIAVKLVHKPSGRPIPDAVIVTSRLDMAPDSMAEMTTPLQPMSSDAPGVYRFKTNLTMAGGWRLSLSAKVQGETGTVQSALVLKALP